MQVISNRQSKYLIPRKLIQNRIMSSNKNNKQKYYNFKTNCRTQNSLQTTQLTIYKQLSKSSRYLAIHSRTHNTLATNNTVSTLVQCTFTLENFSGENVRCTTELTTNSNKFLIGIVPCTVAHEAL